MRMCPLPHYHEPLEYDAERSSLTVRGINLNLEPFAIEIRGEQAGVWWSLLRASTYFHRKANGAMPPREEKLDECT